MYLNIYLDDQTAKRLQEETEKSQLSCNAIIRKAITNWLDQNNTSWPEEIVNYQGEPGFPSFESYREELNQLKDSHFV